MPIQKIFIPWLLHFANLWLCYIHGFASHLICLGLTKPTMHKCFHPSAKNLITGKCHLVQPDILFVLMQVKLGTFLPIHCCAVWFLFNLKYIFVSLWKYNSQNETFDIRFIYWNLMLNLLKFDVKRIRQSVSSVVFKIPLKNKIGNLY